MFVLCPHCQFLVAVDPATGLPPPRCPRCDGAVLVEEPAPVSHPEPVAKPAEHLEPAPVVAPEMVEAIESADEINEPATEPETHVDAAALSAVETTNSAEAPAPATRTAPKPAPSFIRTPPATTGNDNRVRRWRRALVIAILSVSLVMQILVGDRAQLAADARWRPAMMALCSVLRCDLPPWREPGAMTLLDRNVAPDPSRPGVLHVSASFRNDARWPQPWPMLVLTLSDVDGRVAGTRAFQPREYLGRAATKNGLASGQVAKVSMDIIEPAPRIVAFTFDFR